MRAWEYDGRPADRSLMRHSQVPTCRGPKWWRDRRREEGDSFSPSLCRVVQFCESQTGVLLLLLFFHPSNSSSPSSASLWGSEAWETGSKHRSYDSTWPQLEGAERRDTLCKSREQQLVFQHSTLLKQLILSSCICAFAFFFLNSCFSQLTNV